MENRMRDGKKYRIGKKRFFLMPFSLTLKEVTAFIMAFKTKIRTR
jgi:hypothetical protein